MVTRLSSVVRVLALVTLYITIAPACGRLLGIEEAHVDPILDDTETETTDSPTDTVEIDESNNDTDDADTTKPDASAGQTRDAETSDTTNECMSFDNRRVRLLKSDGTLTPLPTINDAVR